MTWRPRWLVGCSWTVRGAALAPGVLMDGANAAWRWRRVVDGSWGAQRRRKKRRRRWKGPWWVTQHRHWLLGAHGANPAVRWGCVVVEASASGAAMRDAKGWKGCEGDMGWWWPLRAEIRGECRDRIKIIYKKTYFNYPVVIVRRRRGMRNRGG